MTGTNIGVSTETRKELKQLGKKGETYDKIIRRLVLLYKEIHVYADDK